MVPVKDLVTLEVDQPQLGFSAEYTIFLMGEWIFVWLQEIATKLFKVG